MRRSVVSVLACALMVSSVFVLANASAESIELGEFPDRYFMIDNTASTRDSGVSYSTTITPDCEGSWWVELTWISGSYVLVQVYEGTSMKTKPLSSTDLRSVGQMSKETRLCAGVLYTVAFTCFGRKASADLEEQFVPTPPFSCVPRDPILIQGNAEFTAENGVVGGDGSAGSPYIISGWSIEASDTVDGIRVESTDAHFVISECLVYSAEQPCAGIYLTGTSNGVIENCELAADFNGVGVDGSDNIAITSNLIVSAYAGIVAWDSTNGLIAGNVVSGVGHAGDACVLTVGCSYFSIKDNHLSKGIWAIWVAGGSFLEVTGNEALGNEYGIGTQSEWGETSYTPMLGIIINDNAVTGNEYMGILVGGVCHGGVIAGNTVSGNGGNGITVESGVGVIVEDNIVNDNAGAGVLVRFLSGYDNVVADNEIARNGVGVSLQYTGLTTIYGNRFVANTIQAMQDASTRTANWDNGLPDGGNYWSDYTGVDSDDDGIGDAPYMIDAIHMDRYPLMLSLP